MSTHQQAALAAVYRRFDVLYPRLLKAQQNQSFKGSTTAEQD
jgi:hypothetical protein